MPFTKGHFTDHTITTCLHIAPTRTYQSFLSKTIYWLSRCYVAVMGLCILHLCPSECKKKHYNCRGIAAFKASICSSISPFPHIFLIQVYFGFLRYSTQQKACIIGRWHDRPPCGGRCLVVESAASERVVCSPDQQDTMLLAATRVKRSLVVALNTYNQCPRSKPRPMHARTAPPFEKPTLPTSHAPTSQMVFTTLSVTLHVCLVCH